MFLPAEESKKVGTIVGVVIGVMIFVVLALIVFSLIRRRRLQRILSPKKLPTNSPSGWRLLSGNRNGPSSVGNSTTELGSIRGSISGSGRGRGSGRGGGGQGLLPPAELDDTSVGVELDSNPVHIKPDSPQSPGRTTEESTAAWQPWEGGDTISSQGTSTMSSGWRSEILSPLTPRPMFRDV